jgi:hypothetical protein
MGTAVAWPFEKVFVKLFRPLSPPGHFLYLRASFAKLRPAVPFPALLLQA